ncbi:MAG: HAD-IB family hydrolase [Synergistaceae bacterium]|jgi:HAD superfamily hydrolase (TIGR01490 family)|nr:HAD-IB family hydrolase [Synergistaceae bacterium]
MEQNVMKFSLALFDFDGTLTRKDTFLDFHRFFWGMRRFGAMMATIAGGCLSRRFDRDFLKETFLARLWKNVPYETYLEGARRYAELCVEDLLLPLAVEVFCRHIERGHDVRIVTASMKEWIEPWASRHGVPLLATELEVLDGRLTGRLSGKNCRGPEKVNRIRKILDLERYDKIYAYGNSGGDLEMLDLADEKVYKWDHVPRF